MAGETRPRTGRRRKDTEPVEVVTVREGDGEEHVEAVLDLVGHVDSDSDEPDPADLPAFLQQPDDGDDTIDDLVQAGWEDRVAAGEEDDPVSFEESTEPWDGEVDALRDSFVAVFGETAAEQVEGASKQHLADLNIVPVYGSSEFGYHFVNCVARDCLTRWRTAHGVEVSESELRLWALETQVVAAFDGTPPDLLSLLDGTYRAWTTGEGA